MATGRAVRELRRIVGQLDPLDPADPTGPPSGERSSARVAASRREELLSAILAEPRPRRGTPVRPVWFGVATRTAVIGAAAGLIVVVAAVVVPLERRQLPAYAATPAPLAIQPVTGVPAGDRLHELAAVAAAASDTSTAGVVEHLRLDTWSLHSIVEGQRTTSAVVPVEVESWRRPDNSGRLVHRYGRPQFTSAQHRQAWQNEGSPGAHTPVRRTDFPPGKFPALWPGRPPSDAAQLALWLQRGDPSASGPAASITAVTDLVRERVLTAAEHAAVLRYLAQVPGIEFDGTVTDRAGRRGEAFSVESADSGLPTRYTLVIDPATGRILAHEQLLTTRAGRLNVPVPAVIGYETYRAADRTSGI
jgi:hypothetical protein